MPCPPEVSEIILDILTWALLRIRLDGWAGDADLCAEVADHAHNLPALLSDYSEKRLSYYWNVERPAFQSRLTPERSAGWYEFWERLRPFADSLSDTPAPA